MTGETVARVLRRSDVGVIEVGRRADLVLLDAQSQFTPDRLGDEAGRDRVERRPQLDMGARRCKVSPQTCVHTK